MSRPRRDLGMARQNHIADVLDELEQRGVLTWWGISYIPDRDRHGSLSQWSVMDSDGTRRTWDTKGIEGWLTRACYKLGIRWKPVPHPGGQPLRDIVLQEIAAGTEPFPPSHPSRR